MSDVFWKWIRRSIIFFAKKFQNLRLQGCPDQEVVNDFKSYWEFESKLLSEASTSLRSFKFSLEHFCSVFQMFQQVSCLSEFKIPRDSHAFKPSTETSLHSDSNLWSHHRITRIMAIICICALSSVSHFPSVVFFPATLPQLTMHYSLRVLFLFGVVTCLNLNDISELVEYYWFRVNKADV